MRPHVSVHAKLRTAFGYPLQDRKARHLRDADCLPEFVGGTVPWIGPRRTFDLMRAMPGAADGHGNIMLITLSMPEGMRLECDVWCHVFRQTLGNLGLPDTGVPWIAFRHRDTTCDHVSGTVIATTFTGLTIKMTGMDLRCTVAHIANCHSLGLPPPPYLFPCMGPRHDIFLPERRQKSADHKAIAASVGRVLRELQPLDAQAFVKALADDGRGVTARLDPRGRWIFRHNETEIPGIVLSRELSPTAMARGPRMRKGRVGASIR